MGQIITVFPEQPSFQQSLTLDGVQFSLRLTFYERPSQSGWYADLFDATRAPIFAGQRLSPGWGLGLGLLPEGAPTGVLFVRGPSRYERFDLGDTVQIVYYPPEEFPPEPVDPNPITVVITP